NNINFEMHKIKDLLGEGSEPNTYLNDKFFKAIGKVEWEDYRWDQSPAEKITLINQTDIVFSASPSAEKARKGKESLSKQQVNSRLFHCSDSHKFSADKNKTKPKELGHCFTWIKADPTFDGLKQVMNEPERVFIGDEPPIFKRVNDNRTKYIKSLFISKVENYDGKYGRWFDSIEIPFNQEMVAIIGNKGSGKSAISDIIGLCGGFKNHEHFSFLGEKKFRDGRHAKCFEARLLFFNEKTIRKNLNDKENKENVERVKYLPQGYFEKITNEFDLEDFRREMESIVFTHLKEKEGFSSFKELIDEKKRIAEEEIQRIKSQLANKNEEIIKLEKKLNPKYGIEVENKIKSKKEEIDALNQPESVKNPNETALQENQNILNNIQNINDEILNLEKEIENLKNERHQLSADRNKIQNIKQGIEQRQSEVENSLISGNSELLTFGVTVEYKLEINFEQVNALINQKEKRLNEIIVLLNEEEMSEEYRKSMYNQIKIKNEILLKEQEKLEGPQKEYQDFLSQFKEWENKKKAIEGDENTPDTLKFLEKEKFFIKESLNDKIKQLREERTVFTNQLYNKKQEIIQIYKEVKKNIDNIISKNSDLLKDYNINIDAALSVSNSFIKDFLEFINKSRAGTFKDDGERELKKLMEMVDFDNFDSVSEFLNNIIDSVFLDKRKTPSSKEGERNLEDQIKAPSEFYKYLFNLEFLEYNYELKQGNKKLEQLSPGERGALLLIFFLLLDKDDKPLILDQPEDNLDNHSVANILVPFIKRAKSKRQIIIVTHNPNLAIVSDAEQIIYVEINKEDGNEFSFVSGSIENKKVNECIVKVLEGAMPAFRKRKDKYYE
ncbi:MAG TPA: hypothetical protein PKV80_18815, partial [Leptospiraceae bacterium]|nr:hypothetical protein [Leptospiraceae bacterium]